MHQFLFILTALSASPFVGKAGLPEEDDLLAELPLKALLTQKKVLSEGDSRRDVSEAPAFLVSRFRKLPTKKVFDEDDYEKGWVPKKKEKSKIHDILNTSVTALSYLAFGGYLLCVIVGALRDKRRFVGTSMGSQGNTHVLQQYVQRPVRIKFPVVSVNHSGRKRRRRGV